MTLARNQHPKKTILTGLATLFIVALIACQSGKGGSDKIASAGLTQAQKDSIAAEEIKKNTVKAEDLTTIYAENAVNGDNKYKGKAFYVSGKVTDVGKDILGKIYVALEGHQILSMVQCYLDDADAAAKLKEGMEVTIKGTCDGYLISVMMKECEIISSH